MDYERRRLRLKADGRIVELRDGRELTFAPDAPSITPSASERPALRMLRERAQLTQTEFAARLGVPVETIRNWEQGKRVPRGPARALLTLVAAAPEFGVCYACRCIDAGSIAGRWLADAKTSRRSKMQFIELHGAKIPVIGLGTWELRGKSLRARHPAGAEARLSPYRHRAGL